MPVKKGSDMKDGPGRTGHFASELLEYLIEDRHDFCNQDDNYENHHKYHDKRISNRVLDGLRQ